MAEVGTLTRYTWNSNLQLKAILSHFSVVLKAFLMFGNSTIHTYTSNTLISLKLKLFNLWMKEVKKTSKPSIPTKSYVYATEKSA